MKYDKWDSEKAVQDYWKRIREHEDQYETVQESFPYVKIWNSGQRIIVNKIEGYLQVSWATVAKTSLRCTYSHVLFFI